MIDKEPDFSGWATRHDIVCSDGLTIKPGAFAHNDNTKVPLLWQHNHNNPTNVLGHAYLENHDEGVYAYGFFNNTETANVAKEMLSHGDIDSLSIFANNLRKQGSFVLHGNIKEVSLVLSGANPEAFIDFISVAHGDDGPAEAVIYMGESLQHADTKDKDDDVADSTKEKTVGEIFNSLTDEQKDVVYFMIGKAVEDEKSGSSSDDDLEQDDIITGEDFLEHIDYTIREGFDEMTRNVFDQNNTAPSNETLSHAQIGDIVRDAQKIGSFRDSFLAHAQSYGIENIDILFPDAKNLTNTPEFIKRRTEWVKDVFDKAKHSPFSRIKTINADITAEEARARGYVKGTLKKEEVISLLRRTTTPTTVYKKQKLDRDDILDITDLDVVSWLKAEMRLMLDEELSRAVLLGDGRSTASEDHIADPKGANSGAGIRSILNDHDMYAHKVTIHDTQTPGAIVETVLRARTHYRGSGTPTFFTTDGMLTDMLLEKDRNRRRIYETVEQLAAAMRVSKIVPVEVMQDYPEVIGIMVNMDDYTLGADKGGSISFFDDFDIDWNQHKYLIETRLSGALTKPKSALVFIRTLASQVVPIMPSFDTETNTITIPTITGVEYLIDDEVVEGDVVITEGRTVDAIATDGYVFPTNITTSWTFTYNEI